MTQDAAGTDRFDSAIEAIYGAAAQPSKWPEALQAIADVFGDVGGVLLWSRDDGGYGTIVSPKLVAAQTEFQEEWWRDDIRSIRSQAFLARHELVTDRHVASPEEIEEHPVYKHFLVPHGLGWFMAATISPDPDMLVCISVQRAKAKATFEDDELEILRRLARHAEQALRLSVRLFERSFPSSGWRMHWRASASASSPSTRASGSYSTIRPPPHSSATGS